MLTEEQKAQLKQALESERERLLQNAKNGLRFTMEREVDVGRDSIDESMTEEIMSTQLRLRDREKFLLNKIDEALERLEQGIIDECEDCGDTISFRRLMARPTTTLCIDCKETKEKEELSRASVMGEGELSGEEVSETAGDE